MPKDNSKYRIIIAIATGLAVPGMTLALLLLANTTQHERSDWKGDQPPEVEQLVFEPMAQDKARQINQSIPFAQYRGPAARPFYLSGDAESRARATDCLASAMWYEAGDDPARQRSVGQIVLNRVRHPAYPASLCGAVFQGSERDTGCQFTFTCDGALARRPSAEAFNRARLVASAMLAGQVEPAVGLATHYHTDWVHPLWSARLDKIAQVGTHLFFRWHGHWGRLPAFRQAYSGMEPGIARLAFLSPAHQAATGLPDQAEGIVLANGAADGSGQIAELPGGAFTISMSVSRSSNVQGMAALEACADRSRCKVIGRLAGGGPIVFLYLRNRDQGIERALWDCDAFKRPTSTQCFTTENRKWIAFDGQTPPVR